MQTTENNEQNSVGSVENGQPVASVETQSSGPVENQNFSQAVEQVNIGEGSSTNVETPHSDDVLKPSVEQPSTNVAEHLKDSAIGVVSGGAEQLQQLSTQGVKAFGNVVGQVVNPQLGNQPKVEKDEKIYAAVSYIPFVAFLSIIIKPDSSFVRLHAKQGIFLSLLFFFVGIFAAIVSVFGVIGQMLGVILALVPLASMVVGVYSMYLAFMGFWWKIPVIGSISDVIPVEFLAKASKDNLTGQAGMAKEDYDVRQEALTQEKAEATSPKGETIETTSTPVNTTNSNTTQQVANDSTLQQPSNSSSAVPQQFESQQQSVQQSINQESKPPVQQSSQSPSVNSQLESQNSENDKIV